MDKLPNEVLGLVFSDFHLFQKQECMLVCRRWSNIIRSTSLFSTVHINSVDMFGRLTKVLDANPSYRPQIQNLIIRDGVSITIGEKQLVHSFPSVRCIHNGSAQLSSNNSTKINKYWRDQIEKMKISWVPYSGTLLLLGVFSGLRSLVIDRRYFRSSLSHIISSAPNVNSLTIRGARISLSNLESIHTGLKHLRSLALEDVDLQPRSKLRDANATNSIITLFISFRLTIVDTVVKWLQYIAKNYNSLLNFKFIFPWACDITSEHELYITRMGLLPLLKSLGHQLEYIEINSSDGVLYILNALSTLNSDKCIVHINTLFSLTRKSFGQIPLYDAYGLIHQLTINLNAVNRKTLTYLSYIRTLKKLRIGYLYQCHNGDRTVCLNDLLYSCSDSLETLEVYDFNIDAYSIMYGNYFLKELAIHSNSISQNAYMFISNSLPSLNRLTIDQRHTINDNHIILWGVDLAYLEVSLNQDYFISLFTLDDPVFRYYHFGPYKPSNLYSNNVHNVELYEPIHQSENILNPEQILHLSCERVKTFVINKQLAF